MMQNPRVGPLFAAQARAARGLRTRPGLGSISCTQGLCTLPLRCESSGRRTCDLGSRYSSAPSVSSNSTETLAPPQRQEAWSGTSRSARGCGASP